MQDEVKKKPRVIFECEERVKLYGLALLYGVKCRSLKEEGCVRSVCCSGQEMFELRRPR